MSSLDTIAVILIVLLLGVAVNFWLSKVGNVYRDALLRGVIDNVPLSLEHRWHILWSDWLPLKSSLGIMSAFIGLAYLQIAYLSGEDSVRLLAYLGAVLFLLGFVFYILLGGSDLFFCVRTLRAANRD